MLGIAVKVADAHFEEKVVKSGEPVLVDFWAPWCEYMCCNFTNA